MKEMKELQRPEQLDFIEFVDEDNADLVKIVNTIDIKDMPPNVKLLWDFQIKQLSAKSANGHRWDPRYDCPGYFHAALIVNFQSFCRYI